MQVAGMVRRRAGMRADRQASAMRRHRRPLVLCGGTQMSAGAMRRHTDVGRCYVEAHRCPLVL